jgi:poly-gamma-glutamate capsule biosynthesis protein CapA/YwtB (metallophosphatase superfamily)
MRKSKAARLAPRLVLVGDVAAERAEPEKLMRKVTPYLSQSAIAFCNCEFPITDRGAPLAGKQSTVVRSSPEKVATFTRPGFDVVSLANNHIMNFGAEGLLQTIALLDKAGIRHCGAGRNVKEAHRPAIVRAKGMRVAFLAYTCIFSAGAQATEDRPGVAVVRVETTYRAPKRVHEVPGVPMETLTNPVAADVDRLSSDIVAARKKSDAVVASFHWGVSGGYQHLVGYQKDLARLAIDFGAKVVVGHHPHTVQPVELYKDGLIAYSLAQCGFDLESKTHSQESIAIELPLTGKTFGPPLVRPIGNCCYGPEVLDLASGRGCLEWLARMSLPLGTRWKATEEGAHPVTRGGVTSFV